MSDVKRRGLSRGGYPSGTTPVHKLGPPPDSAGLGSLSSQEFERFRDETRAVVADVLKPSHRDAEIEDVVQDVIVDFMMRRPELPWTEQVAYLRRFARWRAMTYVKRQRHETRLADEVSETLSDQASEAAFQSVLDKEALEHFLSTLPPQAYEVLWRLTVEGMSLKDVARVMNLTPLQVRKISHKAKIAFRNMLSSPEGGGRDS